jgi:hypothetical protein
MIDSVKILCDEFGYFSDKLDYLKNKVEEYLNAYQDLKKIPLDDLEDWKCLINKLKPFKYNIHTAPKANYIIDKIVNDIIGYMMMKKQVNVRFIIYCILNTDKAIEENFVYKILKFFIKNPIISKNEFKEIIDNIVKIKTSIFIKKALKKYLYNNGMIPTNHKYFQILYPYLDERIKNKLEERIKNIEEIEWIKKLSGIK